MERVGTTVYTIYARRYWNEFEFPVVEGSRYRLAARGQWRDGGIECGPDGYSSPNAILRLAEGVRRSPDDNWFALVGCVERKLETRFLIGGQTNWTATGTGCLSCFANDVPFMYWNNSGSLALTIQEL